MPISDAKKKANSKWNASRDNIMIRVEKQTGQAIRAAAAASGQSVTQYILAAIRNDGGASLPIDHKAIQEHIAKTGESFESFIKRAIDETIEKDNKETTSSSFYA